MAFVTKEKAFTWIWFRAYSLIIVGCFIMALAYVFFVNPYKFAPGGVYGIAIILHNLFGHPISMWALMMDIPLIIVGFFVLGPRFGIKTITGMFCLAGWTYVLETVRGYDAFVPNQPLLSAIYGGFLIGLGLGLVFKSRATSGGSDIIAMMIEKYIKLPLGQLIIYVDSSIVLISWIAFKDPTIPLISWMIIIVTGKVVDVVLEGMNYDKTLFIISDKYDAIRDKIINDIGRGGTFIPSRGMYNGEERTLIFTVVNRREIAILQSYIHEIDPTAFVTILDANEVLGDGFASLKDKLAD